MPLRSPRYLNHDEFFAHAAYHELKIPTEASITESTEKARKGEVGLTSHGVGASGSRGKTVTVQRAYSVSYPEQTAVSKALDQFEEKPDELTILSAESQVADLTESQLVELSGELYLSPVSKAGKILEVARQLVFKNAGTMLDMIQTGRDFQVSDNDIKDAIVSFYVSDEMVPIPTLYELKNHQLGETKVYANCDPKHFVGDTTARSTDVEGAGLVVGTVTDVISGDKNDGYLSTERWTLHGWETSVRNLMKHQMDDLLDQMTQGIGETIIGGDHLHYLQGPALVIDALVITNPLPGSKVTADRDRKKGLGSWFWGTGQ